MKKIVKKILVSFFLFLIHVYQKLISPLFPANCRYYPTCSNHAIICFKYLPLYRALYLTIRRIFRCSPMYEGGFDLPEGLPRSIYEKYGNPDHTSECYYFSKLADKD